MREYSESTYRRPSWPICRYKRSTCASLAVPSAAATLPPSKTLAAPSRGALACPRPLLRRWPPGARQQPGRAGAALCRHRPQELAVRRLRYRWPPRRRDVLADRKRQAQRPQPAALHRRRARPHRRPPGPTYRRTASLELAARRRRPRRSLSRRLHRALTVERYPGLVRRPPAADRAAGGKPRACRRDDRWRGTHNAGCGGTRPAGCAAGSGE